MPTTPSVILADFVAAIKAIAPAETSQSSERFRFVRSREQAEGGGIRTFTLEIDPLGDGTVLGCGNDFNFTLRIVTSYKGLQRYDAQCLIQEDNRQLWQTLALRAGTLDGLRSVQWVEPGWQYEDSEDMKIWGAHLLRVRYLAAGDP